MNTCCPSPAWSLLCSGFWGKKEMLFGCRTSGDFRVRHPTLCCAPNSCTPGAVGAANAFCANRGRQGLPGNRSRGPCSGAGREATSERQRQPERLHCASEACGAGRPRRPRSLVGRLCRPLRRVRGDQMGRTVSVDAHAPVTTCREAPPGSADSRPWPYGLHPGGAAGAVRTAACRGR